MFPGEGSVNDSGREYREALQQLIDVPALTEQGQALADRSRQRSIDLADDAVETARHRSEAAHAAIERDLAAARELLAPLALQSLVPPRITPTIIAATATKSDLTATLKVVEQAGEMLRSVVEAELMVRERAGLEAERVRRQAAEAERRRRESRNRLRRQLMLAAAFLTVIVVAILVVVLA